MEKPDLDDLKLKLSEKESVISEQNRIIRILRESHDLIKKVNKKIIAEKDNTIAQLHEKIRQLQEKIKKYISLMS